MRIFVRVLILAAIGSGIAYCVHALGTGSLTPREDGLMSIVLTGLSILASWVVSDMYSQSQHKAAIEEVEAAHRTNLRTYALKAAEKVTNLSNELNKLATYLQQELDYTDYRSAEEELQAKEERLESAIHLVGTLKSVNDTSLSDWQGVISDEIEEQREEMREKEQAMQAMLMDYERQFARLNASARPQSDRTDETRAEIEALRRDLQLATTAISGVSLPFHRSFNKRPAIELPCPNCGKPVKFKAGTSAKSIKGLRCADCDTRLVARFDEKNGPYLGIRAPIDERYICPQCGTQGMASLDPVPGGVGSSTCKQCGQALTFSRTTDGVRVRPSSNPVSLPEPVTEELIEQVRTRLPAQPWPTGTHREIAAELGIHASVVRRVIEELIRRGDFYRQEDGVVHNPEKPIVEQPTA
jgi:hypothetical protein